MLHYENLDYFMIQILHNSKTESYKQLKEIILGTYFPWYYNGNTTNKDYEFEGHQNIYHFGHSFLVRPEEHGYSKPNSKHFPLAFEVVSEILKENGFDRSTYFFLRLNANCSLPISGEQFSNPHVDHDFPHVNFLAYLSDTGGRTFVDGEEFNPSEDDVIIFTGKHYLELPKKGRRIVIVGTMFGFT